MPQARRLRALDRNDTTPLLGADVRDEVVELLTNRIPLLSPTDPVLPYLRDLRDVLAARRPR